LPWIDRYSGKLDRVSTTAETGGAGMARVQTYQVVLAGFRYHPEAKRAGPDGRKTKGLLRRRVVQETYVAHVGKEANDLEEVEGGLEHDPEVVYPKIGRPMRDSWQTGVLSMLRQMPHRALAEAAGLWVRRLRNVLKGKVRPRPSTNQSLGAAATFTREQLGIGPPNASLPTCAQMLTSSRVRNTHYDRCTHRRLTNGNGD
jgi:hypothetical protein